VLFGFEPTIVYLPAIFACVAGAGLLDDDELVSALALELVFELALWLDGVDVFELLDDLQPSKAMKKRMKAIACARRCGLMFELPNQI